MMTQSDSLSSDLLPSSRPDLPEPQELLPHRPPFLFIDRVVECDEKSVFALRTFRPEEAFFQGHFPDRPIVPGVLLIEALAQAFAYLCIRMRRVRGQNDEGVLLTGVDAAHFRKPVRPGKQVELRVTIEATRMGMVRSRAEARVDGVRVADARLTGYSPS